MLKPKPTTIQSRPDDGRAAAKVAFNALATMLTQGSLPPEVMEHLKNAPAALLDHVMSAPEAESEDENAVPLGESIAGTRRRLEGEEPEEREDDGETDDAPPEKSKGSKMNPLRRWASSPSANDDDEPEQPKKKPSATVAKVGGRPRFLGCGR